LLPKDAINDLYLLDSSQSIWWVQIPQGHPEIPEEL